jgi:hypothetical protein
MLIDNLDELLKKSESAKRQKGILWFGISGSWRKTNFEVERSVRNTVGKIIARGDGIVSGGALNVDYFATDVAMKLNPAADKIKIFLPVILELYAAHYRKRAGEGVITIKQAEDLIFQLEELKRRNPNSIIENKTNKMVDNKAYFERNGAVVDASDALLAFQVNDSFGCEDAIQKALNQGKNVYLEKYTIDD